MKEELRQAAIEKVCENCKFFQADTKPKIGFIGRKAELKKTLPKLNDAQLNAIANDWKCWPHKYNGMGFCDNTTMDLCEPIPNHMSCKYFQKH